MHTVHPRFLMVSHLPDYDLVAQPLGPLTQVTQSTQLTHCNCQAALLIPQRLNRRHPPRLPCRKQSSKERGQ
jgi:hypothetical protein